MLLLSEQGLGDTIQFVRYAAVLKERGARVVLECQSRLAALMRTVAGVDQVVARGEPLPPFDVHARLLTLPGMLGTTPDTAPAAVPYVGAEPARVAEWRERLDGMGPGLKVGIAWQGSKGYKGDRLRSVALREFAPLALVDGVRLVSLQKGHGAEQLDDGNAQFSVLRLEGLDEASGAFVDTAAVMRCLDLVVTTDTSIAHLAGALGVNVWVALQRVPDWRWMLDREDSPWYPTMRLFRQRRAGAWPDVFARMADGLRQLAGAAPRARPVSVPVSPGELLDKIAILRLKAGRIMDAERRANVNVELAELEAVRGRAIPRWAGLAGLEAELRAVNEALWDVEDELRRCERDGRFDRRFVELSRSVYRENDRRAAIKREINVALASRIVEEKWYDFAEPARPDARRLIEAG